MDRPPPWRAPGPLPVPVETPRTLLRFYEEEDAPALHRAVEASRTALLPWLPWAANDHQDPDESLGRIRYFRTVRGYAHPEDYVLGIFDRTTGDLLGGTGLHRIDPALGDAEVGYWMRVERRGEGLTTESTGHLVTSAFRDWGFRRIQIRTAGGNRASQRVAEKLGFRLEARHVAARWVDGAGWQDDLGYAVLREEWDPARHRGPAPTAVA